MLKLLKIFTNLYEQKFQNAKGLEKVRKSPRR